MNYDIKIVLVLFTGTNYFLNFKGLVIFAACAVFTGLTYNRKQLLIVNENFHYSFYLAWASGAVFIIAGSIICRAGSV